MILQTCLKMVLLILSLFFYCCSCSSLTDRDLDELKGLDADLRLGSHKIDFKDTGLLLYGNADYSSPWNDLDSWRNSQLAFESFCHDYFSLSKERTTRIFSGRWGELIHYIESYAEEKLILYFSSHVTSDGYVVLESGQKVSLQSLSAALNKVEYEVLVIFDTCYAGQLREQIESKNVSLVLAAEENELAYDIRLKSTKPTLNTMFSQLRHFQKEIRQDESSTYSLLGALLLDGLLNSERKTLNQVFTHIQEQSLKVKGIRGLSYHSKISTVNLN